MRRLAPYLVLGPISGPLAAGLVACVRARRWPMAAVYAAGLLEALAGLPALAEKMIVFLR